jgi:cobalt/nickel transport system permease protein
LNPNVSSSPASASRFIERTLNDINKTLEQSLFADRLAHQNGLLQGLDARLKLVGLLLFLIAASFSHSLLVIAGLYLFTLVMAAISCIPLPSFVLRIWIAVILFSGLIALPALFITPGPLWVQLFPGVTITQTGGLSALFLILRSGTSISLASLIVLTTPWNTLLKALGVLRLPDVIVLVLGMTYRYIHLLLHAANDMFLSRKSRILRKLSSSEERALLSATSGTLLGKSLQISSDVYLAMQSRGFRYYPKTMDAFQFRRRDILAAVVILIIVSAALWLGR